VRLAVLSTPFGAFGRALEDGRTGFLFEKQCPALALLRMRGRLDPGGLRRLAAEAFARNEGAIDMDARARRLVEATDAERSARGQS